ncbi:outer membrane protein assembly factor BamC [Azoarcus communis]|uniref:Outer membrane protein assembly factor BamC n=1 Tax=Parazoarcus communis SWub3 = DSM 12120 TaxID=1121029 RepID=A0A323UVV9_9RHOO|nr:outer membrane protein assembly factor BamC [Parazoarcus communis]NMG46897.1 outer membrane protein assembly factor BamC [Parazoarcus communis]NMG70003.1 outer membrane protein assembly factor BamC [Parazoarcus communis SWub3 = DSM 12120]PZA16565.1 hypothetical protein DNK49_10595 [Azoarcus communis] [Parazoarcus communis SWub3 = DSM 12120]
MNRSLRTSASLLAVSLTLAGCSGSLLESKRIDYKSARQVAPLEIPPDLTAPTRDDRFAVPDVSPRGVATYSAYNADRAGQPAAGAANTVMPQPENMRIERAGTQRWLVVPGNVETLWPQVKDFWLELGFILNIDSPEIGVLETDWAEDRAKIQQDFVRSALGRVFDGLFSTPERDKFRTRLEVGRDGTVEIYISHRGMMEIYPTEAKDSTIWQPRPADPELEAEMLRRLMIRLGADEARAQAALVSAPPAGERAKVTATEGGEVALQVDEAFDRAWRRVGLALDRIGFTVEDRDRTQGLYFVRYVDPDVDNNSKKSEGFLSKLAFWRSSDKPAESGGEYRLSLKGQGNATTVTVLTREGGVDKSETARRMLGLLQQELR